MHFRYCFELVDGPSPYDCFAYIDTTDNLADFLFGQLQIRPETEMEFHYDDDPYKIVICRVPKARRETFLRAVDMLPDLMAYVGRTDYDAYCLELMLNAREFLARKGTAGNGAPLQ